MAALRQLAALAAPRVLEEAELAPGVSVVTQAAEAEAEAIPPHSGAAQL
jgi:hypothetical protein